MRVIRQGAKMAGRAGIQNQKDQNLSNGNDYRVGNLTDCWIITWPVNYPSEDPFVWNVETNSKRHQGLSDICYFMTPQNAVTVSQLVKTQVEGARDILFEKHEALDHTRLNEVDLLDGITILAFLIPYASSRFGWHTAELSDYSCHQWFLWWFSSW